MQLAARQVQQPVRDREKLNCRRARRPVAEPCGRLKRTIQIADGLQRVDDVIDDALLRLGGAYLPDSSLYASSRYE